MTSCRATRSWFWRSRRPWSRWRPHPLAFAVLGRLEWFKARRGRIMQRPEFSSIVVGMMLVMGIPAIFAALVIKSRSFDRNRYEFDPNRTWSVLDQGREFKNLKEADAAVKQEMERLALERKNLVENVKKLDEAMLALRSVAGTSPAVAQRFPHVLQSLAGVRKSVGAGRPAATSRLHRAAGRSASDGRGWRWQQPRHDDGADLAAGPAASPPAPATAPPRPAVGLSPAEVEAELATVPEPQRKIAAMLPLSDLPPDWTVGKSGERHLETFNADNLYEKIDGRAESFIQYGVKGMAYAFYHPTGDPSNELQLYIFEMADPLKALGKYGSEKPDEFKTVAIGNEGYTTAGSTLFYSGRYYTQIVSTQDDPKFAAFALELAKRVAARQKPGGAAAPADASRGNAQPGSTAAAAHRVNRHRRLHDRVDRRRPRRPPRPNRAQPRSPRRRSSLSCRPRAGRETPSTSPRMSSATAFSPTSSWPITRTGTTPGRASSAPTATPRRPRRFSRSTSSASRKTAPRSKRSPPPGADEMVVSNNIGLVDVVFRKGNTLAGANGATSIRARRGLRPCSGQEPAGHGADPR